MRNEEALSKHPLQLLVSFERVARGSSALHPLWDIPQRDGAVADRAHDLSLGPEVIQSLRHVFVRVEIECRSSSACDVNGVVGAEIGVLELQGRLEFCD